MDDVVVFGALAFSKMAMHAIKHPHTLCCGFLLSSDEEHHRITDAVPISHTSNYLTPSLEVAYSSVLAYAEDQNLVISGYYQSNKSNESSQPDIFGQRIAEKVQETVPQAVICLLSFGSESQIKADLFHMVDGKWRKKPSDKTVLETDPEVLAENVIYTKERLYRQIVDFDEHLDEISLDWTNAKVAERVEFLLADVF